MDDLIRRKDALKAVEGIIPVAPGGQIMKAMVIAALNTKSITPSLNNKVHLCDSCQYTYVTCPSHGDDAIFGDGTGNANICACNKYVPILAQPERKTGKWINHRNDDGHNIADCDQCGEAMQWFDDDIKPHFCPNCGAKMGGAEE